MNILIVTGIFPPDIGGPATYVPMIAEGLRRRGHSVRVITLGDRDGDEISWDFPVVRIRRGRHILWRKIEALQAILRMVRDADVVFVNGLPLESVGVSRWIRKPMVMKVVGDWAWERAHGSGWIQDDFRTFQERRYGLRIEAMKWLRGWWTRQADRVIAPSQYLARWIQRWGVSPQRIRVVYNPVEIPPSLGGAKECGKILPLTTRYTVITVGRLIPLKRVDGIVRALRNLPEVGLLVVGDGPERPRLETLARSLQVADRVHFAGKRSREETLRMIQTSDLLVLNSIHEGFPHVVLEALALGVPVVATAVGGTAEVLGRWKGGALIPPEKADLPKVIVKVLRDQSLRERVRRNRNRFRDAFSPERTVETVEAILHEVCPRERTHE